MDARHVNQAHGTDGHAHAKTAKAPKPAHHVPAAASAAFHRALQSTTPAPTPATTHDQSTMPPGMNMGGGGGSATTPQPPLPPANAALPGGGGGTNPTPQPGATPAPGAQPAHPGTPGATGTPVATVSSTPVAGAQAGYTDPFGGPRGLRNVGTSILSPRKPIVVAAGSANFSFPPIVQTMKSVKPPNVTFGSGWTQVGDHMQHANGTKAYVGIQPHVSAADPSKVKIVPVPGLGKAQLLPGGALVGINERTRTPYVISAADAKSADPASHAKTLSYGVHIIDGFPVRSFQASTVNVITPDGRYTRYDSRGTIHLGRGHGPLAAAAGGGPATTPAAVGAAQGTSAGGNTAQIGAPGQSQADLLKQLQGLLATMMTLLAASPDPGQSGKSHLFTGLPGGPTQGIDGAMHLPVGTPGIDDLLQQLTDPKVLADPVKAGAINDQLRHLLDLDAGKGVTTQGSPPPAPTTPSGSSTGSSTTSTGSTSTST